MTESEAQKFLIDNGPWSVDVDSLGFRFENNNGDVIEVSLLIDESSQIEKEYIRSTVTELIY